MNNIDPFILNIYNQNYGNYEKRHYPEAVMACTYDLVDQAGDPFAGLERTNPFTIMSSRRCSS